MKEIKPTELYTTEDARNFLKVSQRTIKRYLKAGIIHAYKVGGRYRIWGRELLRLVSPKIREKTIKTYQKVKEKTKKAIEKW